MASRRARAPAGDFRIAVAGRNCWRREPARRVAFLVDGEAYFAAFRAAVERAERSILIASWDIDSRTRLQHARPLAPCDRLGAFLNGLVERRPHLRAHVLSWDFAMIYALEREHLPLVKLGWRTHRRLSFRLDHHHPLGGSHHQKIVVVDDALAFAGGLDLCTHRWDTRAHLAHDARRRDAAGRPYGPFHDVQMAVDGAAAAALGTLVRGRWRRATGRRLAAPPPPTADPWPRTLAPDLHDVEIAIARTQPKWNGQDEVREVETLFVDAIAAARRFLYIENQYLTSARVGDALAARLTEPDGPEIVLVLPRECSGWLEQTTMGRLRETLVERLRACDRHGRLRLYHPVVPDLTDGCVNVHAKVMIVDDRLVRIGSANLSNRSMGLDSECDLAAESGDDPVAAAGIVGFRDGLLAEHLGVPRAHVTQAITSRGSLIAAVEHLRGGARTLAPLEPASVPTSPWLAAAALAADPERPIDPERLLDELLPEEVRDTAFHPFMRGGTIVLGLALLIALWPALSDRGIVAAIGTWTASLGASPIAPLGVLAAYALGGLAFVPVTLLILVTILRFDVPLGLAYAVGGTLTSAAVGYLAGRLLGRDPVRRLAGRRLNRLTRQLMRRGPMAVAGARMAALVPFTAMNLVAGASHVPPLDYALGTIIGTVPGVVAIGLLSHVLRVALRLGAAPSMLALALLGAALLALGRRLARPSASVPGGS